MTTLDLGVDRGVGPQEENEPPHYAQAFTPPRGCSCGTFGCDDVSIEMIADHLGIPVHPLADLIGDHMTRLEAVLFEANWRQTYG